MSAAPESEGQALEPAPGEGPVKRGALLIGGGLILAGAMGLYALTHPADGSDAASNPEAAAAARAQSVTVATIGAEPFSRTLTLAGEARPKRDMQVFAPTAGVRVLELLVDEGAFVRAGQPLARLDANLANAQTAAAAAAVKEAEAAAMRARAEATRAESIRESGALSTEAIEARVSAADAAEARFAAAKAQLAEVNARLQGGYVRAPASGLVIGRTAQVGQMVDGQPLFRIAADNALEVAAEVSEADMLLMKPGQKATLRLVDGTPIEARLRRPPAAIDSRTRTGLALFDLPRHEKLRAGMFLRGEATIAAGERLAAPLAAVVFEGPAAFVFVVDADNRARKTPVFLAAREGERVALERGVSAGARIVAGGAAFLQDGDLVRPIDPAQTAPVQAAATAKAG